MLRALKWCKMTTPAPCKTVISWWQKSCYRYCCALRQQTLCSSCFICAAYLRPLLKSYKRVQVALRCEFVFSNCSIAVLVVHVSALTCTFLKSWTWSWYSPNLDNLSIRSSANLLNALYCASNAICTGLLDVSLAFFPRRCGAIWNDLCHNQPRVLDTTGRLCEVPLVHSHRLVWRTCQQPTPPNTICAKAQALTHGPYRFVPDSYEHEAVTAGLMV